MKGEILDIAEYQDNFGNKTYRITIEFENIPDLKLGSAEVKQ